MNANYSACVIYNNYSLLIIVSWYILKQWIALFERSNSLLARYWLLKLGIASAIHDHLQTLAQKSLLLTGINELKIIILSHCFSFCWFSCDVMAATLELKNNSLSLSWDSTLFLCKFCEKKLYCIEHQHGRLVTWLKNSYSPRCRWPVVVSIHHWPPPLR